jgi:hypothetical protein
MDSMATFAKNLDHNALFAVSESLKEVQFVEIFNENLPDPEERTTTDRARAFAHVLAHATKVALQALLGGHGNPAVGMPSV